MGARLLLVVGLLLLPVAVSASGAPLARAEVSVASGTAAPPRREPESWRPRSPYLIGGLLLVWLGLRRLAKRLDARRKAEDEPYRRAG